MEFEITKAYEGLVLNLGIRYGGFILSENVHFEVIVRVRVYYFWTFFYLKKWLSLEVSCVLL